MARSEKSSWTTPENSANGRCHQPRTAEKLVYACETVLRDSGYTVARNDPYEGVQLIAKIGQPALNRYSLQIEIRRPLYMDEVTREPHEGFVRVQADLDVLLKALASHILQRVSPVPMPDTTG